jgi:hypothetical protein
MMPILDARRLRMMMWIAGAIAVVIFLVACLLGRWGR